MDEKKFLLVFAEIVEAEDILQIEDSLDSLDGWGSLAALALIATADEEYGVTIGSKDLEQMEKIQDIIEFIKRKQK